MLDQALEVASDVVAVAVERSAIPAGVLMTLEHEGKLLVVLPNDLAKNLPEAELLPVLRHSQTGELAIVTGRFSVRWSADVDKDALDRQGFVIVRDYGPAGAVSSKSRQPMGFLEQMKILERQPGISNAEPELLRLRSKR